MKTQARTKLNSLKSSFAHAVLDDRDNLSDKAYATIFAGGLVPALAVASIVSMPTLAAAGVIVGGIYAATISSAAIQTNGRKIAKWKK